MITQRMYPAGRRVVRTATKRRRVARREQRARIGAMLAAQWLRDSTCS